MEIGILSLHRLRKDFLRSAQAPREFLFHTKATTTISGITVDTASESGAAWDATKYTVADTTPVKATGGSFVVDATGYTGSTALELKKGAVTGTDATFTVKANDKAAATFTGSGVITLDKATIDLVAHNGKGAAAKKDATVTASGNVALGAGSLTTSATSTADADASGRGAAVLSSTNGTMTLGSAAVKVDGTEVIGTPAQAFDITSDADTTVSASGAMTYNAGTVKNSATLTLTSTAAGVTIEKDVAFAGNTGKIEINASGDAAFNGTYDATAEGFTGGKLTVTSTAGNALINGTIKADTVLIGAPVDAAKDTNSVVINGSTANKIDGTLNATGTLTLNAGFTTSGGSVTAAATKVNASGVAVTVDSKTVDQKTVNPTVDFGALMVVAKSTPNDLTITNNVTNVDVVATTITIEPSTTTPTTAAAGSLTLAKGTMVADSLTVGASGTLTVSSGSAAALTLSKGESNNAGTITLGASGTLTVAKDAVLTNAVGGKVGADTPAGTLDVAGTVKNLSKTDSNNQTTYGVLQADTLNIAKGGVVESSLKADAYKVTTTNIGEGTFKTELNARVADNDPVSDTKPADALELKTIFFVDGGSFVTGTDNKEVTNFVLNGASGALTVGADKALGTVKIVSGGTFAVEDAAVSVKDLNLVSGAATVSNGNLTVEQLRTANTSTVTATDGSTVTASLTALGLTVSGSAFAAAKYNATTAPANGDVADGSVKLDQGSVLKITGIADGTEFTVAGLSGAKALVSGVGTSGNGLIDLGNIKVSGYDTSKVIDLVSKNELAGITYKDLQAATVKASGFTTSAIYGKVQSSGASIEIGTGATLELTGSDGKLISYESGSGNWVNTAVTLASGGEFIATGTNGSVGSVTGNSGAFGVAKGGSVIVEGNVDVGDLFIDQASTMTVQTAATGKTPYTVKTGLFQADGVFTAQDATVELTNTATDATLVEVDTIAKGGVVTVAGLKKATGNLDVLGSLTVSGKVESTGGTINVGDATTAGTLVAGELASGAKVFADPAWVDGKAQETSVVAVKTLAAGATVEGGRNSIIALGTTNAAEAVNAVAATGFTLAETDATKKIYSADTKTVNSVLYVNGGKTAETQAAMINGKAAVNANAVAGTVNAVEVATNSMLAIDTTTVDTTGTTAVFAQAMTLEGNSVVYLANAAAGQTIKLSGTSVTDRGADLFYNGDLLMNADIDTATNNLTVTMIGAADREVLGNLPGMKAAMAMYETGANIGNTSKSALFNDWLYTSSNHASINEVRTAAKDVASLGATTGVQTMTMDAVNQMGETVADRVSLLTLRAAGVNVWAAANGGMFEAKSLFDGAGYESDIYSGVLGVDYQFACNAVLGAALTIGTADTDNKNSTVKASTDSDLVGFSVYTSKTFADVLGVSADIGYLTASNDVTANGYGQNWKFSQDTDAFTIGLRTEVLAEVGAVKLVPHIGIRYTALSTDGFEAGYKTEIDDQNIFQMPVGVTVSGDFQTGDWTVAPKFDLSVVPTFGDKDADLKLGITGVNATDDLAVRVIDSNPVQATLGVNATNGAWGFGLNYKLGVGSDDRMNNTFNVNVRYAF